MAYLRAISVVTIALFQKHALDRIRAIADEVMLAEQLNGEYAAPVGSLGPDGQQIAPEFEERLVAIFPLDRSGDLDGLGLIEFPDAIGLFLANKLSHSISHPAHTGSTYG